MDYEITAPIDVVDFLNTLKNRNKGFYLEIFKVLDTIQENPLRGKPLSHKHKNSFSKRVRNYRIIYKVVGNEIKVLEIGSRDDVYL
jgi:mRNA-degrading endonuclease RelE of RelBE toxin-antitoxin system